MILILLVFWKLGFEFLTRTSVVSATTVSNVKSTLRELGSLEASKLDLPNTSDFSDTSPICETFKHIKRIDELDYLPLSKKKLKKLRKQNHATKSAKSSSSVDTLSPYIVDIDYSLRWSCARDVGGLVLGLYCLWG